VTQDQNETLVANELTREEKQQIEAFRCTGLAGSVAVAFQPVVRLSDRHLDHYEALARFETFTGDESPSEHLDFAENKGLIAEFDYTIVDHVIDMVRSFNDCPALPMIAINLSATSLSNHNFLDALICLLDRDQAVTSSLGFEVTGTRDLDDLAPVTDALQKLKRAGARIGLDDFGVDGTDIDLFRRLEIDYVKIDGSYVGNVSGTPHDTSYLKSIIGLCDELGIRTVAKGIESEMTVAFLDENGFGYGQGYLFGRPRLASSVFLAHRRAGLDAPVGPLDWSDQDGADEDEVNCGTQTSASVSASGVEPS
jgi:EAL domain-containing protein (putative c-di-GMP-specific phosphodiesterase class I)